MTYHQENLIGQDRWQIDDIQKFSLLTPKEIDAFGSQGEAVLNYLNAKDVPPWYRGSSTFQMKAADNLSNALRDDAEQRTTHRVHECINLMGIEPIICDRDIWQLIRLSQGNDLAFLWFLLELHYNTHGVDFTINEQIILSMITHLDMIPTLRELDRILPPPQLPKKEIARRKRLEELKLAKSRQRKRLKFDYALPYFQKLIRPKPIVKRMIINRPDFEMTFPLYDAYKDPNFVQPNETNRWFAKYKVMASRRIADRILNEEIAKIFEDFSKASLKVETVQALCEHHKTITELERKLENELRVIARDRCLKHFDVNGRQKEKTQKRIAEQLERDVDIYLNEFRKCADKSRRESMYHVLTCKWDESLSGESEEAAEKTDFFDMFRNEEYKEETTFIDQTEDDQYLNCRDFMKFKCIEEDCTGNSYKKTSKSSRGDLIRDQSELEKIFAAKQKVYNHHHHHGMDGIGDCGDTKSSLSSEQEEFIRLGGGESVRAPKKEVNSKQAERVQKTSMSDFREKYLKPYDYDDNVYDKTPTRSQTFFEAPNTNKPYLFDYRKIFRFKNNSTESITIKKAFLEALDSDIKLLNRLQDAPLDYEEPVRKCAKQIWKENVAMKNEELRLYEEYQLEEAKKDSPIGYNQDYYDPDDLELMQKMLKDALEYLAKDPKFVLASIPQSYKLPTLRDWIYHRYGKVYSPRERFHLFKLSAEIFRALDRLERYVRAPRSEHFNKRNKYYIDYSCGKRLLKRRPNPKIDYDTRMIANLMEQSRVFWFVMRPNLCSNGPPRDTYFAYMPARPQDITRFRVWKPIEYMDAKSAWDDRRMKLKHQLKPLGQEYPDEEKYISKRVSRLGKSVAFKPIIYSK